MTAPSNLREFKPCPFCGERNVHLCQKWNYGFVSGARGPSFKVELEAEKWWNTRTALATLSRPDGEKREAIARIIDPSSWAVMDNYLAETRHKYRGQHVGWPEEQFKDKASLAKADAILSSGLVQDEATIRADEREKCAKVAEGEIYKERYRTWPWWRSSDAEPGNRSNESDLVKHCDSIAAAIRSGEQS